MSKSKLEPAAIVCLAGRDALEVFTPLEFVHSCFSALKKPENFGLTSSH